MKTLVASMRRAFFDPRPIALEPGFDQRIVTFSGIDRWLLRTPAQGLQPAGQVMDMIVDTKLRIALDELSRAGKIKRGSLVGLTSFGAGCTWGACIVEW